MVDRKTRFLLTEKSNHKHALSVNQAMEYLMDIRPQAHGRTEDQNRC